MVFYIADLSLIKFYIPENLKTLERQEVKKLIIEKGGVVRDDVTRDTWFFVTNDPNGQSERLRKARNIGITFINETELLRMIE
jgi:DNA ligase (NAD+)